MAFNLLDFETGLMDFFTVFGIGSFVYFLLRLVFGGEK